jgi:Fe-S cluster assembly protein SufD
MLSKQARADVVPALEIMENDVKGGHGATVGQVDEEELFYLMSKGLSRSQATRVLVSGFLRDVTDKIQDQQILKSINNEIETKLAKLEI